MLREKMIKKSKSQIMNAYRQQNNNINDVWKKKCHR